MFFYSKYKNIYLHTLRNYKRNQKERARYAKQNEKKISYIAKQDWQGKNRCNKTCRIKWKNGFNL